jgi:uncharacterized protein (TIGR02421 family)
MDVLADADLLTGITALDTRLVAAGRNLRLLASISWPRQVQTSFLERWARGHHQLPDIRYEPRDHGPERAEFAAVAGCARALGTHPLAQYVERTAEALATEAALLDAVGTAAVTGHAIRLFGRPGDPLPGSELSNLDAARHFIALADELAPALADDEPEVCLPAELIRDELAREVDAMFGPGRIQIEIDPDLLAKAAAGPTRIRLRAGTCFSEYDRRQLLEHEAFVHTLTSLNGRAQKNLPSLGMASPRVTATQEGLATFAELMTGSIDLARMKRISLRILAIDMALKGADFVDVFRFFVESGQEETEAFTSSQRVFRGVPLTGGEAFTKDTVYLHGLLGVHTFFRWALRHRRLSLGRALFAGKMNLHDAIALEPWIESGWIAAPTYLPGWMQRSNGLAGMLAFGQFAHRIKLDRVVEEDLVLGL